MAASVTEIIADARGYNSLNSTRVAEDGELLRQLNRIHRELLTRHPGRFTRRTRIAAPGAGNPWVLEDPGRPYHMEKADGTFIEFGKLGTRDQLGKAVYYAGAKFYAGAPKTGQANPDPNPAADVLVVEHGFRPALLTLNGNLDDEFPEEFERLPVLHLTIYMARKRQAKAEMDDLRAEYVDLLESFDILAETWGAEGYQPDGSNPAYPLRPRAEL